MSGKKEIHDTGKTNVAFGITVEEKELIQEIAKKESEKSGYQINLSDIIRRALKEFISKYK